MLRKRKSVMPGTPINSIPCRTWGAGRTGYLLDHTLNVGIGLTYLAKFATNPKPNARVYPVHSLPFSVYPNPTSQRMPNTTALQRSSYRGMKRFPPSQQGS